jgi:hypothetical protein
MAKGLIRGIPEERRTSNGKAKGEEIQEEVEGQRGEGRNIDQ